jgi:hypothetical protein
MSSPGEEGRETVPGFRRIPMVRAERTHAAAAGPDGYRTRSGSTLLRPGRAHDTHVNEAIGMTQPGAPPARCWRGNAGQRAAPVRGQRSGREISGCGRGPSGPVSSGSTTVRVELDAFDTSSQPVEGSSTHAAGAPPTSTRPSSVRESGSMTLTVPSARLPTYRRLPSVENDSAAGPCPTAILPIERPLARAMQLTASLRHSATNASSPAVVALRGLHRGE